MVKMLNFGSFEFARFCKIANGSGRNSCGRLVDRADLAVHQVGEVMNIAVVYEPLSPGCADRSPCVRRPDRIRAGWFRRAARPVWVRGSAA